MLEDRKSKIFKKRFGPECFANSISAISSQLCAFVEDSETERGFKATPKIKRQARSRECLTQAFRSGMLHKQIPKLYGQIFRLIAVCEASRREALIADG